MCVWCVRAYNINYNINVFIRLILIEIFLLRPICSIIDCIVTSYLGRLFHDSTGFTVQGRSGLYLSISFSGQPAKPAIRRDAERFRICRTRLFGGILRLANKCADLLCYKFLLGFFSLFISSFCLLHQTSRDILGIFVSRYSKVRQFDDSTVELRNSSLFR